MRCFKQLDTWLDSESTAQSDEKSLGLCPSWRRDPNLLSGPAHAGRRTLCRRILGHTSMDSEVVGWTDSHRPSPKLSLLWIDWTRCIQTKKMTATAVLLFQPWDRIPASSWNAEREVPATPFAVLSPKSLILQPSVLGGSPALQPQDHSCVPAVPLTPPQCTWYIRPRYPMRSVAFPWLVERGHRTAGAQVASAQG